MLLEELIYFFLWKVHIKYPDGSKFEGEVKDRNINGNGTYTYSDGSKYVGQWKDGKQNGQGTYTYSDGSKYEGEWKDDKKNGHGIFTYPDGTKYAGQSVKNTESIFDTKTSSTFFFEYQQIDLM